MVDLAEKKFVLFDLDGTLIDPKEGITKSIRYALSSFGITDCDDDELCRFIGPPLKMGFMEFYNFDEESAVAAVAKYRERYSVQGIFENKLYSGIENLLQRLKSSGKTLFLATSKPDVYASKILKYLKLDGFFSFVGGAELSGQRNQKEDVIRHVLQTNAFIKTESAVMIGDRKHDIIGARANAIDSVGVLYGYGSKEELVTLSPACLAESVNELTRILCGKTC